MKDFLKEIGNLGMFHIEFESFVILLMGVVLVYILFRFNGYGTICYFI